MANREGFTLIELMVAVVLLVIVFTGLQGATSRYTREVVAADRAALAAELAEGRIEEIRLHPNYMTIDTIFGGTETDPEGHGGLRRVTDIAHVADTTADGVVDYKTVTVTVSGRGLPESVARTVILGAP